ncbi:MAG: YceI family protein [Pseudomonadota bacterium]|nr:YceI family protein [Pseudomonadota bacterium]
MAAALALIAAALVGLAGCAAPGQAPAGAGVAQPADLGVLRRATLDHYRERQASGDIVYLLEPARSDVRIYALRAGAAARFGHNHVITVPHFSGLAHAPSKGLRGAGADLGFRLAELQVDPPALRAAIGGGFAGTLDSDAIHGTLEHLMSDAAFGAASHPWVEISASVEAGETPVAIADVALSLHGETHHQRLALHVHADGQQLEISGMLAFRQGDYGVKPYAVMGGLLAVDDLVAVEFHLRGVPWQGVLP